jgi:hypothetical protein
MLLPLRWILFQGAPLPPQETGGSGGPIGGRRKRRRRVTGARFSEPPTLDRPLLESTSFLGGDARASLFAERARKEAAQAVVAATITANHLRRGDEEVLLLLLLS